MKKTSIASAFILSSFASVNANADFAITNMQFVDVNNINYAVSGVLKDDGTGILTSIDPFYTFPWTATQETLFMDNTGSWSGTSIAGEYNADAFIAAMAPDQIAVGLFFDWNGSNSIAILEIFDCIANICIGTGVPILNGPFVGQTVIFSSHASVVPIPAAAWLMGSGLLGLAGVARRRNKHTYL